MKVLTNTVWLDKCKLLLILQQHLSINFCHIINVPLSITQRPHVYKAAEVTNCM